jgi:CheY-like chemotaxis protein
MLDVGRSPGDEGEALGWRAELAQQVLLGLLTIFTLSSVAMAWLASGSGRGPMALLSLGVAGVLAISALTGRPTGHWRVWLIVAPTLVISLAGFAFVGVLSGPGVCLMVTLMLVGLLLGKRDAMPEGGQLSILTSNVELSRSGQQSQPSGCCVVLEVIDNGSGIPPELLPNIFDPFFTTKPVGKGTGLCLASVAGTIKAHGGFIEVNSHLGGGTAFRVYLPSAELDGAVEVLGPGGVVPGEGEILLVEDDAMVSATAVSTLQSFGYQVTRVADGRAALEQVEAHPNRFRLALLDLRMPGMSGEATFDKLRELEPTLPVLIWSGYAAEQDTESMLRRGAVGFVQKPYRVAELSRIVAASLRAPLGR